VAIVGLTRLAVMIVAVAGAYVAAAGPASAATFSVNPTQIFLSARATTALLTVRNDSDETLRFQLSAFAWDQTAAGDLKLAPTQDVIFFPALLTLAPKEERRIRVGSTATAAATEKTYRVFVEELPGADAAAPGASVRVLTKMGIPIFLRPARETAPATLTDLSLHDGLFHFSLSSTGTVHVVPQRITVRGKAANGQAVFEKGVTGWYILAGERREFELSLPEPDCERTTSLLVEAAFDTTTVKEMLQTPAGACAR
jgi:fimbrial chaperone protein